MYPNQPNLLIGPGRFGQDIEVHEHSLLPDGNVILYGSRYLWVGTKPPTLMEEVGREARMIVRRGMADVLEWLGHEVEIYPTGREVMDRLRQGTSAMEMLAIVNNNGVLVPKGSQT